MTEEALDICGDLAALFQLDDQLVREITVQQTCQMIQAAVDLGDLIRRDGAGLGEAFRLAALAVGGEVGVLHERGGFARQDSDVVAVQLERINDIGVVRMDLNRSEKVCASRLGCCGAEENGAADFVACGSGNRGRGCADASWAGKYASFFIPPVEIPVWAVCSGLRPYTGAALQS